MELLAMVVNDHPPKIALNYLLIEGLHVGRFQGRFASVEPSIFYRLLNLPLSLDLAPGNRTPC